MAAEANAPARNSTLAALLSEPWLTRAIAALLVAGFVLRMLWLATSPTNFAALGGEAENIATSLARTGHFADAFGPGPGTGPTAHLVPTTPALTALVYMIFGIDTTPSLLLLSIIAVVVVLYGVWLFAKSFERLGSPAEARLLAVAIVALVPLQFSLEVRIFRTWEGGIATMLVAATMLWILKLDARDRIDTRSLIGLGALNGLVALISVSPGLATSGMIGVFLLRRVSFWRWPVAVVSTLIVIAMLVVPWAIRNDRVLGSPVLLRSGLGISMAVAYNDYMLGPNRGEAYDKSMHRYSPQFSPEARDELRRVGEVAFNRRLQEDAQAWIAQHPEVTRRIRFENLRDFYFPPTWHFERFNVKAKATSIRVGILWVATVLGFATLAFNLWRRRWLYLYPAAAVILPCLPYIYAFALHRYRYVISTLLIFLACDGAARVWRHVMAKRRDGGVGQAVSSRA